MPVNEIFHLRQLEMYRTVWALCELSPVRGRLKATHYAVWCGSEWVIFNLDGQPVMMFASRADIEDRFSRNRGKGRSTKVWRKKSGAFSITRIEDELDHSEKMEHIRRQVKSTGANDDAVAPTEVAVNA